MSAEAQRRYRERNLELVKTDVLARAARKRQRVQTIKLSRGCVDCGYNEAAEVLAFDHRDDEIKLGNVSQMMGLRWERIVAEIEKCDVRCNVCHAKRHMMESV